MTASTIPCGYINLENNTPEKTIVRRMMSSIRVMMNLLFAVTDEVFPTQNADDANGLHKI